MNHYDWLDAYLLAMPGAQKDYKAEWGWWRYRVGGKLFAAQMCPDEKYAAPYAGRDLLNLKCDPLLAQLLRQTHPEVLPGFYSDKRCWNAVDLGGALEDDTLRTLCDDSYRLVFAKLTKKAQAEILAQGRQQGESDG